MSDIALDRAIDAVTGVLVKATEAEREVDRNLLADYRRDLERAVATFGTLDADEERELALRWQNNGCQQSRDALVGANLRLVLPIARRRLRRGGPSLMELVSEGHWGLLAAANRFRPDNGHRFVVCARIGIRGAILNYIAQIRSRGYVSLNAPLDPSDDESGQRIDRVADPMLSAEDIMIARQEWMAHLIALQTAMAALDPLTRRIFEARHLVDVDAKPVGYEFLAAELGLCRQTISAIARRAYEQVAAAVRAAVGQKPSIWPSQTHRDASLLTTH